MTEHLPVLRRIEEPMDLEPHSGTPDSDELDRLVDQVHASEERLYPPGQCALGRCDGNAGN